MAKRNISFVGPPYCGLAMISRGIRVVESNVRSDDLETQVVSERLDSSLVELLHAAVTGTLGQALAPQWSTDVAAIVVMASGGYLGPSDTGHEITGTDKAGVIPGIHVIQAGTLRKTVSPEGTLVPAGSGPEAKEILVNSGGRVLNVVGRAATAQTARALVYEGVKQISFVGEYRRSDIATWPAELDLGVSSGLKN